jgi:hypothetical protein
VAGQFSIAAAQAVARRREALVTALGQDRMDLEALAVPCTPPGPSPAELPAPAEGLVLVPRVRVSALVLDLVPRALEPVAQVA